MTASEFKHKGAKVITGGMIGIPLSIILAYMFNSVKAVEIKQAVTDERYIQTQKDITEIKNAINTLMTIRGVKK